MATAGISTGAPRHRPAAGRAAPPGPKGLPLVGNLPELARDPLHAFSRWARDYGDVVSLRFGTWPVLLISDPALIERVLVKEHRNFVKNRVFWRHVTAVFGQGLLTSEGEFWQRQRRLSAPAFAGQRLASYGDTIVRLTHGMMDGWTSGTARDIHADMMVLTLKIAASAFFGSEVTEDVAVIDGAVNDLSHEIAARFKRPILIPDWVPLPGHVRYRRALRRIEQVIARMIAERRSRADERSDLLSLLMLAGTDQDLPMSDRQLRDEAVTMLLAGHETTALALSWTWHLLTRHPDMQEQLATQAHEVLGHRKPTIADLPRLTGAEQVINEAMRLYPPAWAVGREALRDCELGGFPVPAGTAIYMCPWVLHRSARYFDDPEAFRPERWAGDLARRLPRFAYFPFGGGPRVCIGNRFALMEAVLVLTTMVQRIRLERIDDRPVVPFASITLRPSRGVWVRPPSLRH